MRNRKILLDVVAVLAVLALAMSGCVRKPASAPSAPPLALVLKISADAAATRPSVTAIFAGQERPGSVSDHGQLVEMLKTFHAANLQTAVTIRADDDLPYGVLAPVLMACAESAVPQLDFIVRTDGKEHVVTTPMPTSGSHAEGPALHTVDLLLDLWTDYVPGDASPQPSTMVHVMGGSRVRVGDSDQLMALLREQLAAASSANSGGGLILALLPDGRVLYRDLFTVYEAGMKAGYKEVGFSAPTSASGANSPPASDPGGPPRAGSVEVPMAQAERIVFICDGSGSMIPKFAALRTQLHQSINALRESQAFQVIFFQGEDFTVSDTALVAATPDNKQNAFRFLDDAYAHGASNPIPALDLALNEKPDVIFLVTDGDFSNDKAVLDEIRKLNSNKKVHVNTIEVVDHDADAEKVLKQIATDNDGAFRFISREELSQ